MPDVNGWPTVDDVSQKLQIMAPNGMTDALLDDLDQVLAAVIAEFQSPAGRRGEGGTGRNFTPISETRSYDGNGYPELRVDDIVPGASLVVRAYDATLSDVLLKTNGHGLGWNVLARPQGAAAFLGSSYAVPGVFPMGKQNISVTATFGYAAQVPADVYEAVRGEVCARLLVQAEVGLAGSGETVKVGDFEVNTAAGVSVWEKSSPIGVLRNLYAETVRRYRDTGTWRMARLAQARRMS